MPTSQPETRTLIQFFDCDGNDQGLQAERPGFNSQYIDEAVKIGTEEGCSGFVVSTLSATALPNNIIHRTVPVRQPENYYLNFIPVTDPADPTNKRIFASLSNPRRRIEAKETDHIYSPHGRPLWPKPTKVKYQVGQRTEEGIYIGRLKSKDGTERDYFAAPTDIKDENGRRLCLAFNEAVQCAKNSNALGHNDWVVPAGDKDKNGAPDVLNAMFNNKSTGAFKGTFDEIGSDPSSWYWSSSSFYNSYSSSYNDDYAMTQRFSNGEKFHDDKIHKSSVRLVRSLAV